MGSSVNINMLRSQASVLISREHFTAFANASMAFAPSAHTYWVQLSIWLFCQALRARGGHTYSRHVAPTSTPVSQRECVCFAALSVSTPLRATLSVANMTMLLPEVEPLLQGQTQASALPNGTISIADLSLVAVPGTYNISATLPDYPQVRQQCTSQIIFLCLVCTNHSMHHPVIMCLLGCAVSRADCMSSDDHADSHLYGQCHCADQDLKTHFHAHPFVLCLFSDGRGFSCVNCISAYVFASSVQSRSR